MQRRPNEIATLSGANSRTNSLKRELSLQNHYHPNNSFNTAQKYQHYAKRDDTNLYFAVDGLSGSPRPSLGAISPSEDRSA